uniref:Nucleolar GTP-binding protein 1 n=1 Tax=Anthurium amnicola TaxID=1678845 RepID=A0A1D1YG71_9ARAE
MGSVGRTFHLVHPWRVPSARSPRGRLPSHFLPKELFVVVERRICSAMCVSQELQSATGEAVEESFLPTFRDEHELGTREKFSRVIKTVGAFQRLPMVMPSNDILCSAKRKARRVCPTKGIANIAKREKNKGAKQLDALMKELAVPLRGYLENFPKKQVLHPYERSLVELTLGEGNYEQVLGRVDSLRKKILSVGKQQASLCAQVGYLTLAVII